MTSPTRKKAPTFDPRATKEAAQMRKKQAGRAGQGEGGAKPHKRTGSKDASKAPPPEPTADLEELPPPFPCFFHDKTGRYFTKDSAESFRAGGVDDVREELRAHGISNRNGEGKLISPQGKMLRTVRRTYNVDYAGPLAGYFAGFKEMNGFRVLVTTSPKIPQPRAGGFATLDKFLRGLFGVHVDAHGATQLAAFQLWAARGWRAIAEQKSLKGHALILAGPASCGKNLLQEKIITPLLGGRAVKAGDYLLGKSDFSGSMFAGESVILTDENGGRDIRTRREFGQRIKSMVANDVQEMHAKGKDSMSVSPRWRLSISVNDETEHLQTLPPVADSDIRDKVHLLLCHCAELPKEENAMESWVTSLVDEIPEWLHHCLSLTVPADLREERPRFGTRAFQHPELLERLNSFSPELHLLTLIDQFAEEVFMLCPFDAANASASDEPTAWEGRASDLRAKLLECADGRAAVHREISELIRSDELCGQYLKRLSQHEATKLRVQELPRTGNKRGWRILPPTLELGDKA